MKNGQDSVRPALKGKFIVLNACIRKEESSKINHQASALENWRNKSHITLKQAEEKNS